MHECRREKDRGGACTGSLDILAMAIMDSTFAGSQPHDPHARGSYSKEIGSFRTCQAETVETLAFMSGKERYILWAEPAEIQNSRSKEAKECRKPPLSCKFHFKEGHDAMPTEGDISNLLDQLNNRDVDKATYVSLLRRCGDAEAFFEGKRLHTHIMNSGGRLATDTFLGNLLVQMYSKCSSLKDAYDVFTKIQHRNVYSWCLMIGAYAQHGEGEFALQLFHQMQLEELVPDKVTYVTILDACTSKVFLQEAELIHAQIIESGFESDIFVGTALLTMYGRCDTLDGARRMFHKMPTRNVVSWNAIAAACIQHGEGKKALEYFQLMQWNHVSPSNISFLSVLEACSNLEDGQWIHDCIRHLGFELDFLVSTALISMYGRLGSLDDARKVFENMPVRTAVSWNAMIAAYTQHGQGKEALEMFQQMEVEGVCPAQVTFASILSACAIEAAVVDGQLIHAHIVGLAIDSDLVLVNALIDMYAKCGYLEEAQRIFDKMLERDVISWNVIIGAHALYGKAKNALALFQEMQQEGVVPDKYTFYSILSGCSHAGLMDEAHFYFLSMRLEYGITPTVEHYNCMTDLLGRMGRLDEAEDLINDMPVLPTVSSWMSLLGACKMHMDMGRAQRAAHYIFKLDHETAGPYVLLSYMLQVASG